MSMYSGSLQIDQVVVVANGFNMWCSTSSRWMYGLQGKTNTGQKHGTLLCVASVYVCISTNLCRMILCSQKHGQHFCFNQKGCKVTSTQCSRTFNFRFTTMDNIVRYQQTIDHIHPVLLISAASCPNTIPRCTQTYEGPSHADKPNLDPQVHQVAYTCGLQALGTCGI